MREVSGVAIDEGKLSFIGLRAGRRLRATGHSDFRSYLDYLRGPKGAGERQLLAEALVTHTTGFFREAAHFDWLAMQGVPALIDVAAGRGTPLTVWSAACSTGAEMWSAAMILDEIATRSGGGLRWLVVGTDISRRILRRAATATFSEDEITGIPDRYMHRYMMRSRDGAGPGGGGGRLYRIVPELRAQARFLWANLAALESGPAFAADIAFLRNVLIYFSPADQQRIAAAVSARLHPGGFLITGHAEVLGHDLPGLRQIGPSIYLRE